MHTHSYLTELNFGISMEFVRYCVIDLRILFDFDIRRIV